jgi:molybdopterin/thiamine biosynthesis adenylyltransferase
MFKFTEEQIKRYARHIILPEVGGKGQEKLLNSKVLVIGAGGLGFPRHTVPGSSRRGNHWHSGF